MIANPGTATLDDASSREKRGNQRSGTELASNNDGDGGPTGEVKEPIEEERSPRQGRAKRTGQWLTDYHPLCWVTMKQT